MDGNSPGPSTTSLWDELINSNRFPAQCNLSVHCQGELKELMLQIDSLIKEKKSAWEKCLFSVKGQLEKSNNEILLCKSALERKNSELESYRRKFAALESSVNSAASAANRNSHDDAKRREELEAKSREMEAQYRQMEAQYRETEAKLQHDQAKHRKIEAKLREEEAKQTEMYEQKIASTSQQLATLRNNYEKLQKKLKREAAAAKKAAEVAAAAAAAKKEADSEAASKEASKEDIKMRETVKEMAAVLNQAEEYRKRLMEVEAKCAEAEKEREKRIRDLDAKENEIAILKEEVENLKELDKIKDVTSQLRLDIENIHEEKTNLERKLKLVMEGEEKLKEKHEKEIHVIEERMNNVAQLNRKYEENISHLLDKLSEQQQQQSTTSQNDKIGNDAKVTHLEDNLTQLRDELMREKQHRLTLQQQQQQQQEQQRRLPSDDQLNREIRLLKAQLEALRLENHHLKENPSRSRSSEEDEASSSSSFRRHKMAAAATKKEMELKLSSLQRENMTMAETIARMERENSAEDEAGKKTTQQEKEEDAGRILEEAVRKTREEQEKKEEWLQLVRENQVMAAYIRDFERQILHCEEHAGEMNVGDEAHHSLSVAGDNENPPSAISQTPIGAPNPARNTPRKAPSDSTLLLQLPRHQQHQNSPPSTSSTLVSTSDAPSSAPDAASSTNTSLQSSATFEAKLESHIHQLKSLASKTVEKYAVAGFG